LEPLAIDEGASRAAVDTAYVRRLAELGALEGQGDGYGEGDVHRVALLHAWEGAGLAPASILAAVRQGELSFSFLETPGWSLPRRPEVTYRELSEHQGVPLSLVLGLHEAIGFHPPDLDERVRQDDLDMVELAHVPGGWRDRSGCATCVPSLRGKPSPACDCGGGALPSGGGEAAPATGNDGDGADAVRVAARPAHDATGAPDAAWDL